MGTENKTDTRRLLRIGKMQIYLTAKDNFIMSVLFIAKSVINNPENKDRMCIIKSYRARIDGYATNL